MHQPRRTFFWLLLAATLSIDAVVFSRAGSTFPRPDASGGLYYPVICDAVLASQLSVICIWAAFHAEKILWLPILIAVFAATSVAALSQGSSETLIAAFQMYGSYYGLEAGLLLVGLWLFRGSKYWRTRTGADRTWQFSLAQLFLAMTVVAVLAGVMRSGPFADESKSLSIGFASSVVGMALASAMVWSLAWHWFLRFAATLGVALVLGEALNLAAHFGTSAFPIFVAHYLVQAIMLSAWLGWGPILPPRVSSVNAEMANSGR